MVRVQAKPKYLSYVLNANTNTIEGVMIVPRDITGGGRLLSVIYLPGKLYEKRTTTWNTGEPLYDFIQRIGEVYEFPIQWEPEPHKSIKKRFLGDSDITFKEEDFFELFGSVVAMVAECGFSDWPETGYNFDPSKICVGIITKDGAAIRTVKMEAYHGP
jgi:hypothetical protein